MACFLWGGDGSVDTMRLASAAMRPWLLNPEWSVRPRDEWPKRVSKAKVRVRPDQWDPMVEGLFAHGIFISISDSGMLRDESGHPLMNGLFGVPKGDPLEANFSVDTFVPWCHPMSCSALIAGRDRGTASFQSVAAVRVA